MTIRTIVATALALFLVVAGVLVGGAAQAPTGQKPEVTSAFGRQLFGKPDADGAIAKADAALAADPKNLDLLIAAGRARDTALQYNDAIRIYGRAIEMAPNDVRGYRFRGHRYISTRQFDLALADLQKAIALAPSSYDVVYHLGLAQFLTARFAAAAGTYQACLDRKTPGKGLPDGWVDCAALMAAPASANTVRPAILEGAPPVRDDESRISLTDWLYRSLRRAERHDEAKRLLDTVSNGLPIKASEAYYRALLFYKGVRTEAQALPEDAYKENTGVTVAYGLANFYLAEGKPDRACALFRRAVADEAHWNAFGYIGSEVELTRLNGPCGTMR